MDPRTVKILGDRQAELAEQGAALEAQRQRNQKLGLTLLQGKYNPRDASTSGGKTLLVGKVWLLRRMLHPKMTMTGSRR